MEIANEHRDYDVGFFVPIAAVCMAELRRRHGRSEIIPKLEWPADRYSADRIVELGKTAVVLHHIVGEWAMNQSDPADRAIWVSLLTLTTAIVTFFVDRAADFDEAIMTLDNERKH